MKNKKLFLSLFVLLLSGCSTTSINYIPSNLTIQNIDTIAADVAPIIEECNPVKNTAYLVSNDAFGKALAKRIRKYGYEVMMDGQTEQKPVNAEVIRYTIDWLDIRSLYVAITINNKQRYIRNYDFKEGDLIPGKTKIIGTRDE